MSRETRAEERIDEIDVSPAALTAQVELLRAERDEAVSRSDEYVLALQRERAEFMNFKRRTAEELLESEGVTQVEASPGTPFDPREHEAIVSVPGTGRPEGEIVDEVRRGYRLRDRVIRPALVAVATAADAPDGPTN